MIDLRKLAGSATFRDGAIALVMGVFGFAGHAVVEIPGQAKQLDQHEKAITALFQGKKETDAAVAQVSVAVAQVNGKLDVLNQKIDDHFSQPPDRNPQPPLVRNKPQ